MLLRALYGLHSTSVYPESPLDAPARIGALDIEPGDGLTLKDRAESAGLHVVKTHEMPGADDHPAVYLVRDGRDAVVSYAWWLVRAEESLAELTPRALDLRFRRAVKRLIVDETGFGAWSRHVAAWLARPHTVVVRFEDLVTTPQVEVARALGALGLGDIPQIGNVAPGFSDLKKAAPGLFRRGRAGGWQDEMPDEAQRLFANLHGLVMRRVGYDPQPACEETGAAAFFDDLGLDDSRRGTIARRVSDLESALVRGSPRSEELLAILQGAEEALADLRFAALVLGRPAWRRVASSLKRRVLEGLGTDSVGVLRQHLPRTLVIPSRYHREPGPTVPVKISIVTPSLNSLRFLGSTIASVHEQKYPNLEYCVQDGGSGDGTIEYLKACASPVDWKSTRDDGPAAAINAALGRTTGAILGWLNADDILLPGALRYVARYFEAHPHVDVVYGHRVVIDEQGREIGRWILPPHDSAVLPWADYVPQESLFWRRSVWAKVGACLDPALAFAFDWDLLLRFRAVGARFARVPRFLAAFRVHPDQKTSRDLVTEGHGEMRDLRKRIHGRRVSDLEVAQEARPYRQRARLYARLYRLGLLRH